MPSLGTKYRTSGMFLWDVWGPEIVDLAFVFQYFPHGLLSITDFAIFCKW